MNEFDINDIRIIKEMRSKTFSKYKKTDVKRELLLELTKENLEQSLYWSTELICSGCYMDIWETILLFISKYIHLGNPKIPIYVEMRFNNFKNIIVNGYIGNELALRNNQKIRLLFGEVISVLCLSPKRHSFETVKINKTDDFQLPKLQNRLKAPDTSFAKKFFRNDDPEELFMAINELAYHLSEQSRNLVDACFWIEWILEYENQRKQTKKTVLLAERRDKIKVHESFQKDIIWIIWDAIFYYLDRKNKITEKIMNSILGLYTIHYSSGCKRRRKYLLYFAITILIDTYNPNIEIIRDKNVIEKIKNNINSIYKQIKRSEIAPQTEYLFDEKTDRAKTNLEKTVEKMDLMNEMMKIG